MKLWIKKYFYPLCLFIIVGFLCWANYTPGTYLSGWDTLHPEFNFSLAFKRVLNGVWRTDQGLGAVAIQSHMAELPRLLYLYFASWVFPLSFLRYSYFFLMLFLGPLGMYFLTKNFPSALIYLANLGTLQHFAVPLEMFATQYGLLPWIMLLSQKILQNTTKKYLMLFGLLSFFASSQAHTATLWYAFFLAFILFVITYAFLHKNTWKQSLILVGVLLITNAYWIFPNIYATVTQGDRVREAKVNRLFTPEAVAKGEQFANLSDTAILKNFLFDWELYRFDKNRFEHVLAPWQEHVENPLVRVIGYGVWVLSLFGIWKAKKEKNTVLLSFLPIYVLSFSMLLYRLPLTGILAEALRFPFTKFSILLMLSMSIYAGYTLSKRFTLIVSAALLFYFAPAFSGNLMNTSMRIQFPNEYFQMFDWFDKQSHDERVAILPIHSFYNWTYYDWGYQGAGFLQFGIPQPILDRDYDRWNPKNEQYMREMTYAVYSHKPELLASVLQKFNITWVLVDTSVANIGGRPEATYTWLLPDLLQNTGIATVEKEFGDTVKIYKVKSNKEVYKNVPSIGPILDGAPEDTAYSYFGPYITTKTNTYTDPYRKAFTHDERFTYDVPNKIPMTDPKHLDHGKAYLVTITHKNSAGFPMQICISNPYNRKCDLLVRLKKSPTLITEQFLLPPVYDFAYGYTVDVQQLHIGNVVSDNVLENVTFYQINYDEITGKNTHINPDTNTVVSNNQSYSPGWIAFADGKLLTDHVLVNNWSNGWILPNEVTNNEVTIFYWPQLLQWSGFVLIFVALFFL